LLVSILDSQLSASFSASTRSRARNIFSYFFAEYRLFDNF